MRIGRDTGWCVLVVALGLWALPLAAELPDQPAAETASSAPEKSASKPALQAAPNVGLDQLLQLPDSYGQPGGGGPKVAGASAEEWRSRFNDADLELVAARQRLAKAQRTMEAGAGDSSQWQIAAPGASADPKVSGAGLSNRQRVRRYREEVEAAERRVRALEVEADLADVPKDWRK